MKQGPYDDIVAMLNEDNSALREAGCSLAIAAMRVVRDADGLHRLSLAVAKWANTIASEGRRPHGSDVGHNTGANPSREAGSG
jgi:hypothetical protein